MGDIEIIIDYQEKGDTGLSAYQIAVKNGFVGTEAEWEESLKQPAIEASQLATTAASNADAKAQAAQTATTNAVTATTGANNAKDAANTAAAAAQLIVNSAQYKGTFDSVALAIEEVLLANRKLGDTVGIKENGSVVEYWWKSSTTDGGLVSKLDSVISKDLLLESIIGQNKFNKATIITGYWINNSGVLTSSATSAVSSWIPIDNTKPYFVSGGRGGSTIRFKDANENILPPYNSSGTPIGYAEVGLVGVFYCPPNSTHVQINCILSGGGDINTIQLAQSTVALNYAPYSETLTFKQELVTEKVAPGDLFERVNLFDKSKVLNGLYIVASTGLLGSNATSAVSAIIPVNGGQVYYIQGRTTAQSTIVFYDVNGNKLKPYSTDNIELPSFAMVAVNGIVIAPPTSVSVQFTIKFVGDSDGIFNTLMFSKTSIPVEYKPYDFMVIKPSLVPPLKVQTEAFKVKKEANAIIFRTSFDSVHDIYVTLFNGDYLNRVFNIKSAKLLLKSDLDVATGIVLNGTSIDEAAPTFFNGTTIGGNHGSPCYTITANAHGKTLADVGAKYQDANGNYYTILKVNDINTLLLGIKNTSVADTWVFPIPVSPMTYSTAGNSTTAISFTASSLGQLTPSIKNVFHKLIIDDKEQAEVGTYYGDRISLIETYDIIDYPDMLDKLSINRPSGGYLTQPEFTNGDTIISITNIYSIQLKGVIALVCSWGNEKTLTLDRYFGITQNAFSAPAWATFVRRYLPKTLPIINNGNTFDFRLKPDFKTPVLSGYINITSQYWEGGKPVNRMVDLLESAGLNINFNLGYLPVGGDRSTMVSKAWEISNVKKSYPIYIDGKIGAANVITAGTVKQGVAFRGWSKPSGIRTNDFLVENGGKYYLYLDYHSIGTDTVELPSYLLGKEVTVIDKSANVELITSIVTGNVKVKITASTPMYGYCELLIS